MGGFEEDLRPPLLSRKTSSKSARGQLSAPRDGILDHRQSNQKPDNPKMNTGWGWSEDLKGERKRGKGGLTERSNYQGKSRANIH